MLSLATTPRADLDALEHSDIHSQPDVIADHHWCRASRCLLRTVDAICIGDENVFQATPQVADSDVLGRLPPM